MTELDKEQILEIRVPGLRRAAMPAIPLGIRDALIGDPVGDAIIWITVAEDVDRLYPWYTVIPLFHPDHDGMAIEVGTNLPASAFGLGRLQKWFRRDPDARDRLASVLALEIPIVQESFGAAAGWAKHVMPDERDYDDFPDLLETMAYADLLSGAVTESLSLLSRLELLDDTVGRRSAAMRAMIEHDPGEALGTLAGWRERRLAMFGLDTAPSASARTRND